MYSAWRWMIYLSKFAFCGSEPRKNRYGRACALESLYHSAGISPVFTYTVPSGSKVNCRSVLTIAESKIFLTLSRSTLDRDESEAALNPMSLAAEDAVSVLLLQPQKTESGIKNLNILKLASFQLCSLVESLMCNRSSRSFLAR